MRIACTVTLALLVAAPATAGISTAVNPFGVPTVGTGIALYAETSGTEPVTAQQWSFTGNIVNNDAPGTAAFLPPTNPPPLLQRQSEAALANIFDAGTSTQWEADDSYWDNFFTTVLLGAGYNGSGTANPGGVGITTMELQGGTTFGPNPDASELLLYIVITAPVAFYGELAIGAGTIEQYGGPGFFLSPDGGLYYPPEPTSFALVCVLGLMLRRRR